MLEPANTLWGQFIYQNFHHEPFDPPRSEWELPEGGAMSMANGALPWIVFKRDVETFNREFPELKKVLMRDVHPLLYLISGGVSMKQLLPQWASPLLSTTEYLLSPLNPLLGMFSHIVIEKTGAGKEI